MKKAITLTIMAAVLLIFGCYTGQGSKTYTRGQAQQSLTVYYATVLKVSEVQIEGQESGLGAVAGAVVGNTVGSTIGKGRGKTLAKTGGTLAGAAAGSAAEKARATKAGLEIEIEMDDGRIMVIVQEKDDEFAVGDRVRVLESKDGTLRVRQ